MYEGDIGRALLLLQARPEGVRRRLRQCIAFPEVCRLISNIKAYVKEVFHSLPKAHTVVCGLLQLEVQPQGLQRCMYGAPAWDIPCACAALSGIAATVTLQLKLPKPLAVRQT